MTRLVWLARDHDAPIGGELKPGRFEHSLYGGRPMKYVFPSGRRGYVSTARAPFLGTLHLPIRGLRKLLKPGECCRVRVSVR